MKEQGGEPHAGWSLDRDLLELELEARAATNAAERRRIRAQLDRARQVIREQDTRHELRSLLPDAWALIYGEVAGYLALFSGIRTGTRLTQPHTSYHSWPGKADAALAWVAQEADASRELYHCAHLLSRPHRRKAAAAPLAALYVDLDHDVLPAGTPEPSVVVASSPGRWQCYWQLSTPVPPVVGEQLNRRLARLVGADPSGWDLTQLLRVPGTPNHKYPEAPLVQVLQAVPIQHDPITLDRMLLEDVAPPPRVVAQPGRCVSPAAAAEAEPPVPLSEAARRYWRGERPRRAAADRIDRSASLVQLARVLYDAGVGRDLIVGSLAERDATLGWRKYSDRPDGVEQYHRIVDLLASGPPPGHNR